MAHLLSKPFYLTSAESTLGASLEQRGLGGMQRTAATPGPNMFDSGAASKVAINNQPATNLVLQQQNIQQNLSSAMPQAQADAVMDVNKQQLVADNAAFTADRFMKQRTAEVAAVMGSPAIQQMGLMSDLELAKLRNDTAVAKAQAMGINPALIQNEMSAGMYSA